MPPLKKNIIGSVELKPRTAQIAASTDVLVVGGGPAGIGAAVGAAQAGARVVLTERYGFLGGAATAQLVNPFMSAHTQEPILRTGGKMTLYPVDHGHGERVIKGLLVELMKRLLDKNGAIEPSQETGFLMPFDPEILKIVLMDLVDDSGVEVLLHSFASTYIPDKDYPAVVFETKSGPVIIKAKCIVDCTGDGDIAVLAGAPFEIGRENDGLTQPMTLYFRMAGFQKEPFFNYVKLHPEQWYGVFGLWDLIKKAGLEGMPDLPREDLLMFTSPHPNEVSVNSTRVVKVLGVDVWDLSRAEWESRRQMMQVAHFLTSYVPGFENSYPVQSGVQVGIRETRRIIGDYKLCGEDIIEARKFPDCIARCAYPLDIHNPLGKGTRIERLPPGESYDIPIRSLFPKNCDRLLVAGRCISGTHEAHSSYRIMPEAMATGQAAGVSAAFCALENTDIRALKVNVIQYELLRQGVDLGNSFPGD
jgi:hypothetical protein